MSEQPATEPQAEAPEQTPVTCMECGTVFASQPADFLRYNRWSDQWLTLAEEDGTVLPPEGYCKPCQIEVEANRPVYGGRDSWMIEQRTMEDERFVWDR